MSVVLLLTREKKLNVFDGNDVLLVVPKNTHIGIGMDVSFCEHHKTKGRGPIWVSDGDKTFVSVACEFPQSA